VASVETFRHWPPNCFDKKVHVENFPQKNRQTFRCQVFLDFFFGFLAFSGVSQRWEFKNTTKNVLQKIVSKSSYKKIDKNAKTDFFLVFVSHVFGRFSVRGVQKHQKKFEKTNLSLITDPFWSLTHPPTTGSPICFGPPCIYNPTPAEPRTLRMHRGKKIPKKKAGRACFSGRFIYAA
jgi:hypothetical protein